MPSRSRARRRSTLLAAVAGGSAILLVGALSPAQAASTLKYKTYKVPTADSEPRSITVGSDGNLWFTEEGQVFTPDPDPDAGGTFHSNIGRITPGGDVTEFRVECGCLLGDIVQGGGGFLYFTSGDGLGRIATDGAVQPFINAPFSVSGQDLDAHGDDIWITDVNRRSLWRYTASGGFTEFPIGGGSLSGPSDVVVDASGKVWFGGSGGAQGGVIGRLDPTVVDDPDSPTRENVTTFDVAGSPNALSVATDGKVWFTDRFQDTVGYLDPANDNQLRQFPTPDAGPQDIAAAPDGSMWFTQADVGNAARITADGVITEAGKAVGDDPDSGLENALGIAVLPDADGPDGPDAESVWFTMQAANKIASLR